MSALPSLLVLSALRRGRERPRQQLPGGLRGEGPGPGAAAGHGPVGQGRVRLFPQLSRSAEGTGHWDRQHFLKNVER